MKNENVIVYTKFLSEKTPLLVEYEQVNDCIYVLSIRFIRKVVNGGQVYARADGTSRRGPIYEATWLYGWPGLQFILTPSQLCLIDDLVSLALKGPHDYVPEVQIVYAKVD